MSETETNPGEIRDVVKQPEAIIADNRKALEFHKQAALHYQQAAKYHLEAVKHHEAGDHDQAYQSALLASGHACIASDQQCEDAKYHALNGK